MNKKPQDIYPWEVKEYLASGNFKGISPVLSMTGQPLFEYEGLLASLPAPAQLVLVMAGCNPNPNILPVMEEHGVDIKVTLKGADALMFASARNNKTVVEKLLEIGFEPYKETDIGETALHLAALLTQDREVIKLLVDWGADPKAQDSSGNSPAIFAARRGADLGIIEELVSTGCDLDAKDGNGFSPLWHALHNPNPDIAKAFIRNGAKINSEDFSGERDVDVYLSLVKSNKLSGDDELFEMLDRRKGLEYHKS